MREFFVTGKLFGEVNATLILLVPKIPTPGKVSDFRPIACCNVLYKCISKIMTNRLKEVLGTLVNENQSAFISGRQITNNILLAHELFKGYNRKQNVKKVSFKINLQKAYDTINWEFLKDVLVMFGFHGKCNGGSKLADKEEHLFCHGDCKSVRIIKKSVDEFSGFFGLLLDMQKSILGSYPVRKLEITHLCFADDLLVFFHGDCESVRIIKKSLDEFSGFFGLLPNMQKSTVFFGGLSSAKQQNILNIIPFSVGKLPVSLNDENEDTAVWVARNGQEQQFKISNVWKDRIYNDTKVDWFSMVWFAQSIPRHAFVTWLAIQKRLMTRDKLLIWRPNDDFKCALCNKCPDSHNHLFFTCDFSKRIWNELLKMLNVRLSGCSDQIIDEMKALPANNIWSIVRRLVCCASVYYIWQERNNRLFKNEKRDNNTILNTAKETLGMKLIGIKVKESTTVKEVEERWNVKMQRG
ncbi:RNA-directed DNA polymerase, eukaryota, reverse transcriptase zinc-binding domain protein [Tanacetum coccineum]